MNYISKGKIARECPGFQMVFAVRHNVISLRAIYKRGVKTQKYHSLRVLTTIFSHQSIAKSFKRSFTGILKYLIP